MNQQPKPSEIVIMASGAVAFVFSFFSFQDFGGVSFNAWDSDATFPLATYIAIFGLLMAAQVAVARFANVQFPHRVLSFTWEQIHFALAVFCGLLAIGFLILAEELAIGFWFMFLASAGLVVGATMQLLDVGKPGGQGAHPGQQPPYPGQQPPPPGQPPYPGQQPPYPGQQPPQQF